MKFKIFQRNSIVIHLNLFKFSIYSLSDLNDENNYKISLLQENFPFEYKGGIKLDLDIFENQILNILKNIKINLFSQFISPRIILIVSRDFPEVTISYLQNFIKNEFSENLILLDEYKIIKSLDKKNNLLISFNFSESINFENEYKKIGLLAFLSELKSFVNHKYGVQINIKSILSELINGKDLSNLHLSEKEFSKIKEDWSLSIKGKVRYDNLLVNLKIWLKDFTEVRDEEILHQLLNVSNLARFQLEDLILR